MDRVAGLLSVLSQAVTGSLGEVLADLLSVACVKVNDVGWVHLMDMLANFA